MQEHSLYARRLDTLRSKLFLTDAEQLEEVRLKKLKLSLKDEMERLRRLGASYPQAGWAGWRVSGPVAGPE
jgi:hypothetical protein